MGDLIVGIGEFGASATPGDVLKTYALGSCVAVILVDRNAGVSGLLHVALPDSGINRAKARGLPGYFADSGIPALISVMRELGCQENGLGMDAKLVGGASILDQNELFNIGKRNQAAIKQYLQGLRIAVAGEDLGGNHSRTVTVVVGSGIVTVNCPGRGQWQI